MALEFLQATTTHFIIDLNPGEGVGACAINVKAHGQTSNTGTLRIVI